MKLISTTLSNGNQGHIAEALKSVVDHVDLCLVIDTGICDGTLKTANEVAKNKLKMVPFKWVNDFAAARNFALAEARKLGADFALTLDCDERIFGDFASTRMMLDKHQKVDCFVATAHDLVYCKERIIRTSSTGRWTGATHEYFECGTVQVESTVPLVFFEIPKSELQLKLKYQRDLELLKLQCRVSPKVARWPLLLASTLYEMGQKHEALLTFENTLSISTEPEEKAWISCRSASICEEFGEFDRALNFCLIGMRFFPNMPELFCLAGAICLRLQRLEDATSWGRMATTLGIISGRDVLRHRQGSRKIEAYFEDPFKLLAICYQKLGDVDNQKRSLELFERAKLARLKAAQSQLAEQPTLSN